ncbi:recombination protein NinB [Pasteurella multocida]|uniref:recombination protein NinB n=1 Tax=Pasteurella multocida TaxID=747 RepID=UPI002A5735BA|nr:recombination protein NinB [Pasteurella multocida]MDY0488533.1 recombination protein NinB [Pasteurella multocida]MDY0595074.1 recombination protein NinB [Pasteurella multocida]MDY0664475.1 recombination protein NinB [Pasteurella multocida]MDY0667422.1 recombination protein NinB [Pasteurella multocida]
MEHDYPRMYLVDEAVRNRIIEKIRSLPLNPDDPLVIEIKVKTRSMEQNDKFHAMLGDISKQATWQGDKYDLYGWKNLIVSGHTIATKLPYKLVTGIEGELVNVREQTSRMGVKRMSSLIEYTTAWGVSNGVRFKDRYGFWGK